MMKKKLTFLGGTAVVLFVLIYQSCVFNDKTHKFTTTVTPQQLPSVVQGFNFPEDSNNIYAWLNRQDTTSIANHAWGIWAGLTANSNQIYNGDTLLIYETWLGVTDIAAKCDSMQTQGGCSGQTKSLREHLSFPRQLTHGVSVSLEKAPDTNPGFYVSVAYDPNAACYATTGLMLNQGTINRYIVPNGIGVIPAFPSNAITIKPTYFIGKMSDSLIKIPAWQGPTINPDRDYPSNLWNSYIYVDVRNGQTPGKIATPVDSLFDGNNPPESAVVNLSDFIYYALDAPAANFMNKQQVKQTGDTLEAGNLAILVAMHVATKEISNWTWQTFFWSLNPAQPDFPSSQWQANLRPQQLFASAASHYALSTAYAMIWPVQPISNGSNTPPNAQPIIGYNPFLEPGLSVLPVKNNFNPAYKFGMQSNCMSCHALATSNAVNSALAYTADQYISLSDTNLYKNYVRLDFAWSIQGNLNPLNKSNAAKK